MKLTIATCFFLCLLIYIEADAVSLSAQKKYPYILLSNDYGILSENDLGDFSWGFKRHPLTLKDIGGNYWQCFPRRSIEIMLKNTGLSADLVITVWVNPNLIHEYGMRAQWPIADFEKRFNKWRTIMQGEKYVCLAGDFVSYEHKKEKDVYSWIFEKIKTKQGCDSYLYGCNPTYGAYLKRKAKEKSYKSREIE